MRKTGLHILRLVFPPFSNQEGEWLWDDADVRGIAERSKLYMIGQRREVLFENLAGSDGDTTFRFDLVCGTKRLSNVVLPLGQFAKHRGSTLLLHAGSKIIKVFEREAGKQEADDVLVHWFTPDRLFYYYSKHEVEAENLETFRQFSEFQLYYVGISKRGDSFSRLFKTAHEKRSRILGNEKQLNATARLTDELMIFLFDIEDLNIIQYDLEDLETAVPGTETPIDAAVLAADAEKALIQIAQAKYNAQTYASYPKSKDGLWTAGFDRYGFAINEDLIFTTAAASIRGGTIYSDGDSRGADLIFIDGETVTLLTPDEMRERLAKMTPQADSARR